MTSVAKPFSSKVSKNTFYENNPIIDESDDAAGNEELVKRKRAWAELERE